MFKKEFIVLILFLYSTRLKTYSHSTDIIINREQTYIVKAVFHFDKQDVTFNNKTELQQKMNHTSLVAKQIHYHVKIQ